MKTKLTVADKIDAELKQLVQGDIGSTATMALNLLEFELERVWESIDAFPERVFPDNYIGGRLESAMVFDLAIDRLRLAFGDPVAFSTLRKMKAAATHEAPDQVM